MAQSRASRRAATSGKSLARPGKTYPRSSLRTTTKRPKSMAELSSDEASDEDQNEDADEESDKSNESEEDEDESDEDNEEQADDQPDEHVLSSAYPFEFGDDGSLTGTDDEMELDLLRPTSKEGREFEKSMALADAHAEVSIQDLENDDYDGVNAISDDDDDDNDINNEEDSEEDVLREAEKDLIAEFEQAEHGGQQPVTMMQQPRLSNADKYDETAFALPSINMNEDPFQGAMFMDDTWGTLWETAELGIWRKPGADNDMPAANRSGRQKRVRFQDSSSANARPATPSTSESSDEDDEEDQDFPDIFMEQSDPKIQLLLAQDSETEWNGLSTNGSDAESVYDFEDDADRVAFELDEDSDSSNADFSSESEDDGDDTEDETVEEQQAKMQQFRKAMRKAAAAAETVSTPRSEKVTPVSSTVKRTPARFITPKSSRGPQQGTFICDPTKATLTTDSETRKTILYPPSQPPAQSKAFWERAKSATQLNDGSPRPAIAIPAHSRDDPSERPFTARATLASMFDGRMDVFEDMSAVPSVTQPFPKFVPSLMSSFTASTADDGSDMDAEYPAEFSNLLNMEQFQDDSSDTDMATPGGMNNDEPAFLSQGVVGSFRLNQHRAKVESSLPLNPAKRNAAAEHNALQSGRRAAGNAPITPARKRRTGSQDLYRTGSGVRKPQPAYGSPIAARRRHSRGQSLSGRLDQTLTPEMWKKM